MESTFFEDFVEGFVSVMPENYDVRGDQCSPSPWCTPWYSYGVELEEWFDSNLTPFEMGMKYGNSVKEYVSEIIFSESEY